MRVIVVEDNPIQQAVFGRLLDDAGHTYTICGYADPLIRELMDSGAPDLIIMDVILPGDIDGGVLLRLLREDPRWAHIPIIMVTGLSPEVAASLVDRGAQAVVYKPISRVALLAAIARATALDVTPVLQSARGQR